MTASFVLMMDEQARWHVARVEGEQVLLRELAVEGEAAIASLTDVLREMGYRKQGVVLGLPTKMVFSSSIECEAALRKQRRDAMLFQLEEQFPMDIETLTVDFLPPVGGRRLGVAVETARVQALMELLAGADIETVSICPTALLALREICRAGDPGEYALMQLNGRVEIMHLQQSLCVEWFNVPLEAEAIVRTIRADQLSQPSAASSIPATILPAEGWALAEIEAAGLKARPGPTEPILMLAARAAGRGASGDRTALIELRRDALAVANPWMRHAGLVQATFAGCMILLVAMAASFWWQGQRYDQVARQNCLGQQQVFEELYPNTRVPLTVKRRLESEWQRLAGIRGMGEIPRLVPAVDCLRQVLEGLPATVRLRVHELRVSQNEILIEGQARTHTDAEDIHHSLTAMGFIIDPPRTERLASGAVAFTLLGKPILGQGKPAPDSKNAPDVMGGQSVSGDSGATQPASEEPSQGGRVP